MTVVTALAEQWETILSDQPGDWSQLRLELRLADGLTTERVCVVLAPLNPWRRDDDYRSGVLRFRSARTVGYGAAPGCNGLSPAQENSIYGAPSAGQYGQPAAGQYGQQDGSPYGQPADRGVFSQRAEHGARDGRRAADA